MSALPASKSLSFDNTLLLNHMSDAFFFCVANDVIAAKFFFFFLILGLKNHIHTLLLLLLLLLLQHIYRAKLYIQYDLLDHIFWNCNTFCHQILFYSPSTSKSTIPTALDTSMSYIAFIVNSLLKERKKKTNVSN